MDQEKSIPTKGDIDIPNIKNLKKTSTNNTDLGNAGTLRKRVPSDFVFGKILGEGSYSTVVLAREKATQQFFAIKVLNKRHIIKEKKIKYVNVEKDVLNKLNHPFIIKLYYTFQDQDSLYFALELAKHGDLLRYIRKLGHFDIPASKFYIAELILAVEHMHSKGVLHRDLKPEVK